MIDEQVDLLEFTKSQIAGLVRFNRKLETVLSNMRSVGQVLFISMKQSDTWGCSWEVENRWYVGQGDGPKETVLACLERAKYELERTKTNG